MNYLGTKVNFREIEDTKTSAQHQHFKKIIYESDCSKFLGYSEKPSKLAYQSPYCPKDIIFIGEGEEKVYPH